MSDKFVQRDDGKEITPDIRNISPTTYDKNPPHETVARPSVPDKIKMIRTVTNNVLVVSCLSYETIGTETRETRVVVVIDIKAKANIKANITHKNIDGLCKLHAVLIEIYSLYKDAIERFTTQMIEIDYRGDEKFVEIIETYMGKEMPRILHIDRERKKIIVSLIVFIAAFSVCPTYKPQRAGSYKKKRKKRPTKRKNRNSFKKRKSKRKTKRR